MSKEPGALHVRVALFIDPGGVSLMNELTLATGIATETFNYTADQAVSLRVRKGDDLVGFDQIWQFEDPSTFVDETTDANDVGGNDWDIFPAAEGRR